MRPIVPLGPALSKLQATVLELLPGKLMSRDNLLSMQKDNVCDCPFPAVFGIAPVALEVGRAAVPGAERAAQRVRPLSRQQRPVAGARAHAAARDSDGARACRSRSASIASAARCATNCWAGPIADRDYVVVGATPGDDARVRIPPGRPRFSGVPASGNARGIRARAHRAQARPRLSRLRVLRVARRHARRGPRAARPDDQRDGARRRRRAHRSATAARPISPPACCATCRRPSPRIRCACCASRASRRASASRSRRKPRR